MSRRAGHSGASHLAAVCALLTAALLGNGLDAEYATLELQNVPIDRLIANLETHASKPQSAATLLNLARVHGMAFARGVKEAPGDNIDYHGPNVVLECNPLPFAQRAKLFKEGIRVVVPSQRRVPPDSLTPRAKTHNYLNLIVADQEVQSIDPEAWAVLLDVNGNLAEGLGSNIFVVRGNEILTPRDKFVLPGVSRQTAIDLAREQGLTVSEADLDLYDAYNADEMFLTSTSLCICPVTKMNGVAIGPAGQVWGPVTRRIADAYQRFVDHDFVGQYLKRYTEGMEARAF